MRVRRLTEQEGQKLQWIVRRGSTGSLRFRRAMMLPTSSGGWKTVRMGGGAIEAYGALLDGSLALIREASRDARSFDRAAVYRAADVWDNNTFPLFRAARARTAWGRERRARTGLRWMSELGPSRREWMVGLLGPDGERLVPPPAEPEGPDRDLDGRVRPGTRRLTADVAGQLALDYLLPRAEVRRLRVEVQGERRLTASLELAVPRAYAVEDGSAERRSVTMSVDVDRVTEVVFDSADASGVVLRADADTGSVHLGAGGVLRGDGVHIRVEDRFWYLSRAGRRAQAEAEAAGPPAREVRRSREPWGWLGGPARIAAEVLRDAMLHVRGVGHPTSVGVISPQDVCDAFEGAGRAVVSAGALSTRGKRDAAFERLVDEWIGRCSGEVHRRFREMLYGRTLQEVLPRLPDAGGEVDPRAVSREAVRSGPAMLRLARYRAPDEGRLMPQPGEAVLNLAVPSGEDAGAPWRMHVPQQREPARFQLRTEAFWGTGRVIAGDFENGPGALLIARK
ncbi:hypothetical protein GCM10010415_72820 [Streptomyces atrovirens]